MYRLARGTVGIGQMVGVRLDVDDVAFNVIEAVATTIGPQVHGAGVDHFAIGGWGKRQKRYSVFWGSCDRQDAAAHRIVPLCILHCSKRGGNLARSPVNLGGRFHSAELPAPPAKLAHGRLSRARVELAMPG